MGKSNGKPTRLTSDEIAALTRARAVRDDRDRIAAVKRATTRLRVGVRVTPSLYRSS